jgi:hypothetical protein
MTNIPFIFLPPQKNSWVKRCPDSSETFASKDVTVFQPEDYFALQFSSQRIILILKMVLDLRGRDEYSERPLCLKKLSPQLRRFRYFFYPHIILRTHIFILGMGEEGQLKTGRPGAGNHRR